MVGQFYKPTIVFSNIDGILTGSARSVKNFDIHEAITQCSEWVEQFGGHKYAAGLSIKEENFASFKQAFEAIVADNIQDDSLLPEVEYDLEIDIDTVDQKFLNLVKQMEPFGPGNPQPIFYTSNLRCTGPRVLKDRHLKFQCLQRCGRPMPIC